MKKLLSIFLLMFILIPNIVYAHPGRTDSNGGHTDNSTGEYHYHHGYSAHQHKNGTCPYNFKDKTDYSINYKSNSSSEGTTTKSYFERDPFGFFISTIIFLIILFGYFIPMGRVIIDEIIYNWKHRKKDK